MKGEKNNTRVISKRMFTQCLEALDFKGKIGATGFEPATSRPPAARATKLRHTPINYIITNCA